ncbi:MAG: hypothetical protein ACM3UV_00485 [Nocardioidaceae bacterium]
MLAAGRSRWQSAAALLAAGALVAIAPGCGDDFERRPRPPVGVELTGVIRADAVTVSPSALGAGPVLITVSNQTREPHTLTLAGGPMVERVGPINPLDTATIQKTLVPGSYALSAGSPTAMARAIRPAVLRIGRRRPDSNARLLQP